MPRKMLAKAHGSLKTSSATFSVEHREGYHAARKTVLENHQDRHTPGHRRASGRAYRRLPCGSKGERRKQRRRLGVTVIQDAERICDAEICCSYFLRCSGAAAVMQRLTSHASWARTSNNSQKKRRCTILYHRPQINKRFCQ